MRSSLVPGGLVLGSLGLAALGAGRTSASPPQSTSTPSVVTSPACAPSLRDQGNPSQCLAASSIPELGSLYPISPQLFVDAPTGRVGIGTTSPRAPLEVIGTIGMGSPGSGIPLANLRPSGDLKFGVIETYTDLFGFNSRALLMSTVANAPSSGALATQGNGQFLALVTSPISNPQAGYFGVLNANVETAGINGATGDVFGASKSFVQPHPTDGTKEIHYVSLEGPEHGVYFRGSAALVGGQAVLEVPESFRLVARDEGLTVNLTALGPTAGLYVAAKGRERIVVRENPGGAGDASFDFLVMGVRSALPEHVAVQPNVHFAPQPGTRIAEDALPGAYRELMIRNGTLGSDGTASAEAGLRLGWKRADGRWSGGPSQAARPAEPDARPAQAERR